VTDPAERAARGSRPSDRLRVVKGGSSSLSWWKRWVRRLARKERKREDMRRDEG
jgi:hypothetical protein